MKNFLLQLLAIFLSLTLVQALLSKVLVEVNAYWALFWCAEGLFVGLSVFFYFMGDKTSKSENKNHFSQFVMLATFLKMLFSLLVIIIYVKKMQPTDKWFLLPFFMTYLAYTIFETSFMSKLGRAK